MNFHKGYYHSVDFTSLISLSDFAVSGLQNWDFTHENSLVEKQSSVALAASESWGEFDEWVEFSVEPWQNLNIQLKW